MNSSQREVVLDTHAKGSPRGEILVGSGVLNVGIVGCGRIAVHHLRLSKRDQWRARSRSIRHLDR